MAICLTILNFFLNFMYFIVQTCLIYAKPQTKTASKFKGDINIFDSEYNLEYEKNPICARLMLGNDSNKSEHCSTLLVTVNSSCFHLKPQPRDIKKKSRALNCIQGSAGNTFHYFWVVALIPVWNLCRFSFEHMMNFSECYMNT